MNRQMKRTVYEAPITECFHVEMEGAFCSGSADVDNPQGQYGEISAQEVNTGFTTDFTAGAAVGEGTNVWD
jgi:hypothetical protein